ncbi:MAG TPA: hypothetical protein VFW44_13645 [Bryobacteraceae bacterium]|nr:hypothetical protein [Bryobacteraceae bacterium]
MACPYFYPVARFETSPWSVPPRLPLGDAFSGECRAPSAAMQPDESQMREVCNAGPATRGCNQFPSSAEADAVRFHVSSDSGAFIRIQYVLEKQCWPVEHGLVGESLSPILQRQADAFRESYLRRRNET